MCCIVKMGRQIAKTFSTFSPWGSLFLMRWNGLTSYIMYTLHQKKVTFSSSIFPGNPGSGPVTILKLVMFLGRACKNPLWKMFNGSHGMLENLITSHFMNMGNNVFLWTSGHTQEYFGSVPSNNLQKTPFQNCSLFSYNPKMCEYMSS